MIQSLFKKFSRPNFRAIALFCICAFAASLNAEAQTEPTENLRRETLLNGLKVVFAPRPETQVVLKLRVAGGAAFDLAGKEGEMALLGDTLFPDAETRQLITREFGGRLDVTTDYDALTITLAGRADEFKSLFEILRSAVLNQLPAQDVIAKLAAARREMLIERMKNPSYLADRAVAARLYGDYPLGRPVEGTPESVMRITRADLALARERFLNPNNSVLVIAGNFDEKYARAAVSQFLGVWRKSETEVPATFRQPEPPNSKPLAIILPDTNNETARFAVRGVARNDPDRTAADVLAVVMQAYCLRALNGANMRLPMEAENQTYRIGGLFVIRQVRSTTQVYKCADEAIKTILKPPTDPSFTYVVDVLMSAKRYRQAQLATTANTSPLEKFASTLLNETVSGVSLADELRAIDAVTPADIQRVANRLLRNFPQASVAVGAVNNFQQELSQIGIVEVTDAQTFIASLSVNPTKSARETSTVRPLQSLTPAPQKSPANSGKQTLFIPTPKLTLKPTPTPTPPKQP